MLTFVGFLVLTAGPPGLYVLNGDVVRPKFVVALMLAAAALIAVHP